MDKEIVTQHIGWLMGYAELMDERNWRDMKDRITQQLKALAAEVRKE